MGELRTLPEALRAFTVAPFPVHWIPAADQSVRVNARLAGPGASSNILTSDTKFVVEFWATSTDPIVNCLGIKSHPINNQSV